MLKYYITVSLRQFAKTLNQFFFTYIVQKKMWKVVYRFHLSNWKNWSLGYFHWIILKHIDFISKMQICSLKTTKYSRIFFTRLSPSNLSYAKGLILKFCTLSIFPALGIQKVVFVNKMLWRFDIILHIKLNNLFFH